MKTALPFRRLRKGADGVMMGAMMSERLLKVHFNVIVFHMRMARCEQVRQHLEEYRYYRFYHRNLLYMRREGAAETTKVRPQGRQ